MKSHFKDHISKMRRYQTSTGRDIEAGLRLDRNERVADAEQSFLDMLWQRMPPHILHVTPDIGPLYEDIAEYHGIDRKQLYIAQGITECSRFLYETLTLPGQNVVVLDPTYPMYMIYAEMFQLEYRRFTYGRNRLPDWQSLYRNVDDNTSMVVIANPNLPIESAFDEEAVRQLADYCQQKDIVLVVDEAYHGFGSWSALPLVEEYSNLVVMRTFSKAWGLPAIRLGYMISQAENIEYLSKTRSLVETNAMSMEIARYAIQTRHLHDDHVAEVKEGVTWIKQKLASLGYEFHGGDYTNGMVIFLESADESKALVKWMRDRKIYIRGSFEEPWDACVRISIGPSRLMARFFAALEDWTVSGRPV